MNFAKSFQFTTKVRDFWQIIYAISQEILNSILAVTGNEKNCDSLGNWSPHKEFRVDSPEGSLTHMKLPSSAKPKSQLWWTLTLFSAFLSHPPTLPTWKVLPSLIECCSSALSSLRLLSFGNTTFHHNFCSYILFTVCVHHTFVNNFLLTACIHTFDEKFCQQLFS